MRLAHVPGRDDRPAGFAGPHCMGLETRAKPRHPLGLAALSSLIRADTLLAVFKKRGALATAVYPMA